jgi:predicted RNase H-like nuclease (RuvC/YqgF family)
LPYTSLISTPEVAIRSLLEFVGEPFSSRCLEPLAERINTSDVPADFKLGDPKTDPLLVEQATQLSAELEQAPQPSEPSSVAAAELEAVFQKQVEHVSTLDTRYRNALRDVTTLQNECERLHTEQEQMRQRYETELRRVNMQIAESLAPAETVSNGD